MKNNGVTPHSKIVISSESEAAGSSVSTDTLCDDGAAITGRRLGR